MRRVEVALIQTAYQSEGADEIGGEVFSVINVVSDSGLGVWVERTIQNDPATVVGLVGHGHLAGRHVRRLGPRRMHQETRYNGADNKK